MPTDRLVRLMVATFAGLTALWWWAEPAFPSSWTYFAFRAVAMQYSGVLAIAAMSLAMVLALRLAPVERLTRGLDKAYRLHKWLGISALVLAVLHWWLGQGTKWMTQWGWLVRPERRPRVAGADEALLEAWFNSQRHLAESVGEWAFYVAAVLLVLALVKRFPYRWFTRLHTGMALVYLALVFHSVVLARFPYWSQPLGWVMAPLMLAGTVAAVWVLSRQVGRNRQVRGEVVRTEALPGIRSLAFDVQVSSDWPGHRAGQFVFLTVSPAEGAHPFTLTSAWDPATRRLSFLTKALGDHTRELPALLQAGTPVTVEGPYGCFDFSDGPARQVWIGAGVGITPFLARLQQMARHRDRAPERPATEVDLFHPTVATDPTALAQLQAAAQAAGVRLHVTVDARDGRLDGPRLRAWLPDWQQAGWWFCGPAALGRSLAEDLLAAGLPRGRFHQELFEMR